ncbi:lactate racemase domain-containing protein [Desulfovermiculus halophilus]|jgi:hypothetical protein|uniref:lactate racemase domain-containing protein n=1 Tax=Desulfovermiculus halophilus TaxID=339722 RepID=UPI000485CB9C|nr:lactate racemase domain-containing protein [Desulfovermiculus halophilus]
MPTSEFPSLAWVEQHFDPACVADIQDEVTRQVQGINLSSSYQPGQSVAITAGSRGIDRMDRILAALIANLKHMGLRPYIVPSMGSHGGASAEGQVQVLASYGITEQEMGAPILSSMDTVCLGYTDLGTPVVMDQLAAEADHIVVVNRIKAHTKFKAKIESGLMKMLAIGLGNHAGASRLHALAPIHGLGPLIEHTGRYVLDHSPLLFGLGIVENAFGRCALIRAVEPAALVEEEKKLLVRAKRLAAKIPWPEVDLLIVDRIGKDISGTGMDTNVTGRNRDILGDFCSEPRIKRIVIRGLTPATEGNALGLGFADFCTTRAVQAMDKKKTYTNAMTGVSPEKAAIPMHLDTDQETIAAALDSLGHWTQESVRVVRIQDTLHLQRLQASPALLAQLPHHCSILGRTREMQFDVQGNLNE